MGVAHFASPLLPLFISTTSTYTAHSHHCGRRALQHNLQGILPHQLHPLTSSCTAVAFCVPIFCFTNLG